MAALDLAKIKGGPAYREQAAQALNAMQSYKMADQGYATSVHPGPGSKQYMDDNTSVALAYLQGSQQLNNPAYLHDAEGIMQHLVMPNTQYVHVKDPKTGRTQVEARVPWFKGQTPPRYPTTVASRTVEVAAKLYQATQNKSYLNYAMKAYNFMEKLREPGKYLWAHRMTASGKLEGGCLSVVQGSVIGALTSMYQATKDPKFLNEAKKAGAAGLQHFTTQKLEGQAEVFNAAYFRNLEKLQKYDPQNAQKYQQSLNGYLAYTQAHGRVMSGANRDFFDNGGLRRFGAHGPGPDLLDQAGMVQMLALQHMSPEQVDLLG